MPASIPIPQLKIGKRKERSQVIEALTDDGRWIDHELPVNNSCMPWEEVQMAFLVDSDNQYQAEDGNWHQLITEKDMIPLCLRKPNGLQCEKSKELENLGNGIFKVSFEQKLLEGIVKAKTSESWNKFVWIVSIVCGAMVMIAGIRYFGG